MSSNKPAPLHKTFEAFLTERRYEVGNLPGNSSFKSTFLEKGRMMKLPPSVTLSHQPYRHIDHLEFMNVPEIQDFVREWQLNLHMVTQRCGWMYGYYIEDPNYEGGYRAVVEGIYEPPQSCVNDEAIPDESDPFLTSVDQVAEALGLERVGFIFTSLARDSAHLLNSHELLRVAKMQLSRETREHYTKYALSKFCTCITHPDMSTGATPQTDVFMVSDQFCAMVRDRLVEPKPELQPDTKRIRLRDAINGEMLPQVLEAGKAAGTDFDPDWFIVKVNSGAPMKPRSFFVHSHFPRENRLSSPQFRSDIKRYLSQCSSSGEPSWSKFSDFHLLLFIAKILDVDSAKVICEAVRDRKDVGPETVELLDALGNS